MSSFTDDLIPGEKVLAVSKKNWTIFFNVRNIVGIILALLFLGIFPLLSFIILAVLMIPTVLEYVNTELVLTNMRLRGKEGAFHIKTLENKASYFVGNFRTQSNLIFSSPGSDTIIIQSAGVGHFVFTHMKNAKEMSNALYSLGSGHEVQIVNKI